MRSAKIASNTMTPKMARPTTAPRFSRNAAQNATSEDGGPVSGVIPAAASTAMADPWIDAAVKQIDAEIDQDHDRGDQHDTALQRRIVAPANCLDQPLADSGPGEDRFSQYGTGQQRADLQAYDGYDRDHGVAQRVQADHADRNERDEHQREECRQRQRNAAGEVLQH